MTIEAETGRTQTASQILDVADRLVQTRGFNDFSYADIAGELSLTKAALHYHFRSKAALGDALISRYAERFFQKLELIEAEDSDATARLEAYVGVYRAVLAAGRMCLCGVLAAEYQTLPETMRAAVLEFFDRNEEWLEHVLRDAAFEKGAVGEEPLRDIARMIIDTLEGAMMIARAQDDPARFDRVASRMLSGLIVK
jgi:TetR/AcrR family transcriptional regulator, transcriptional repressor for nem operon